MGLLACLLAWLRLVKDYLKTQYGYVNVFLILTLCAILSNVILVFKWSLKIAIQNILPCLINFLFLSTCIGIQCLRNLIISKTLKHTHTWAFFIITCMSLNQSLHTRGNMCTDYQSSCTTPGYRESLDTLNCPR